MVKATWNGQVIAESDQTEQVEGNHYFPPDSVQWEFFKESEKETFCGWKGTANYFDIVVGCETNKDAAWVYREPKSEASNIRGYVAFWNGVQIA